MRIINSLYLWSFLFMHFALASEDGEQFELLHLLFHQKDQDGRIVKLHQMDLRGHGDDEKKEKSTMDSVKITLGKGLKTAKKITHRLKHRNAKLHGRGLNMMAMDFLPRFDDKATVIEFAKMASNSYARSMDERDGWIFPDTFNTVANLLTFQTLGFGWQDEAVRGYVFANKDRSIIVMAIKGTSASFFGIGDSETAANDKLNVAIAFKLKG